MMIRDLLVLSGLVSAEAIETASRRHNLHKGRLAERLVAAGAVDRETLERFLDRVPNVSMTVADTGINEVELLNLMLKQVHVAGLVWRSAIADAMKLPVQVVAELIGEAVHAQLLTAAGSAQGGTDMRYALSDKGRRAAAAALERSRYVGPAPVPLESFRTQLTKQKVTDESITWSKIQAAFDGLTVADAFIDQIGPAVKSGRAVLLYGPPGNGKTTIAMRIGRMLSDIVYIPWAVMVEGHVMRVFDPALHEPVADAATLAREGSLAAENADARWMPCRRPFVVAGGELTLEMLDLRYDAQANFYEAPLHIKAGGGCLLIDDFGRQIVSPATLLNRWIVPLENRVDNLKLHTGMSFSLPFETLVVLATNLAPADLLDPAFLRRVRYKLELAGPTHESWRAIFEGAARAAGFTLTDDVVDYVAHALGAQGIELAAYQPQFIVEQVSAGCQFRGQSLHFDRALLDYAIGHLTAGQATAPPRSAVWRVA